MTVSTDSANEPAIVLGGGIAGLAAAGLLARHYRRVVVLERDVRARVASPDDAFAGWERSGVPQFRHSHAFLARARLVLLAHLPDVLDRLRAVGVPEMPLADTTPLGLTLPPRVDDEDVVLLASTISQNQAGGDAGGLLVADDAEVRSATIVANRAPEAASVTVLGDLLIFRSIVALGSDGVDCDLRGSIAGNPPFLGADEPARFPRPYVKWSAQPERGEDVPAAFAEAYRVAMTPPRGKMAAPCSLA